jgi:dienelactone hydrolase
MTRMASSRNAGRMRITAAVALVVVLGATAATALAFDSAAEQRNFSKTHERSRYDFNSPEFQARLSQRFNENIAEELHIQTTDPERRYEGNICAHRSRECAGDVRFYDWEQRGFGMARPVIWTARSGAVISGTVWATRAGPPQRPGIVITTGSIQAPETLYWGIAATLAKKGYVVLTYDVQGQGRSDTFGEGVDALEGVPSQQGRPFYDGTEDALDFMLSTPDSPYQPRRSCTSGTSHSPKHNRRVADGLATAHNPLWEMLDPDHIGIAGHSLGAAAVSNVGQADPRVDVIVAWDNLRTPGSGTGNFSVPNCPSGSSDRAPAPITKPALGFSNDYGLTPTPYNSDPNPEGPNTAFMAYQQAGVDAMQLNIRGGTHYEYSYIPGVEFDATLRGLDLAIWYTAAWFDKYLKGDSSADRRLLTTRWLEDPRGAQIDPSGDGNLFSFYLRSRFAFTLASGEHLTCADMRNACQGMQPDDCPPGSYSYLEEALTPDDPANPPGPCGGTRHGPCEFELVGKRGKDRLVGGSEGDTLRGRGGRDFLRGRGGRDCLAGGRGGDRLDGGRGGDDLSGGAGRDRIDARDREADSVRCGRGRDRAKVDRRDRVRGCEKVREKR